MVYQIHADCKTCLYLKSNHLFTYTKLCKLWVAGFGTASVFVLLYSSRYRCYFELSSFYFCCIVHRLQTSCLAVLLIKTSVMFGGESALVSSWWNSLHGGNVKSGDLIFRNSKLEEALHLTGELAEKEKLSQRDEKIDACKKNCCAHCDVSFFVIAIWQV